MEAVKRGGEAWAGAMGSVGMELGKLQALLADYSIASTPGAELSILLTTGRASAALQQFLSSHLGQLLLPAAAALISSMLCGSGCPHEWVSCCPAALTAHVCSSRHETALHQSLSLYLGQLP